MTSATDQALKFLPPKSHLAAIGAMAAIWSHIESNMELTICGLYEIDLGRGLVLTSNLGFHARLSLLRILASGGAIKDAALARDMTELLNRVDAAYGVRNQMVHGIWIKTDQPDKAARLSLRARGKRIAATREEFTATDLWDAFSSLAALQWDFVAMSDRLGIESKLAGAPKHSTARA